MKLSKVRITNFQCVHDSTEFDINDITCLIGKNQSGKTAILKALYYSNPIEGGSNSEIEDCLPLAYIDDVNPSEQVVESTYTLDVEDIDAVQKYVTPGCLKSSTPTIKLKSEYNYISTIASDLDVDIDAILKHISTEFNIDIPSDIKDRAETANYLIESIDKSKNDKIPSQYKQILQSIDEDELSNFIFDRVLKIRSPKFIYIDKYYQMKGEENLNDLLSRQSEPLDSDRPILDFFDLAGISIGDITRINSSRNMRMAMKKIQPKLESVSKEILKFWSQYVDYEIDFDIRDAKSNDPAGMNKGTNIWIQVINKNLDIDNRFRNESAGFNSFFSLLVRLSKIAAGNENIILLLDEPGLSLHPEAQVDLLRYFESITETHHQIIYTTHSPFMIDPAHLDRVRPVENLSISMEPKHKALPNKEKGTKVSNEISDVDTSGLFVLQGVLGYDVLSDNILVVEGRSDKEYIKTLSSILNQKGRKGISPSWSVIPAHCFGNIKALLPLIRSLTESNPNLAVLVDYEKARKDSIKNLSNKGTHVITCKEFSNNEEKDADIEDIFSPGFYLGLVNSKFDTKIEISELRSKNSRIVQRLKDYFIKENPLGNNKGFRYAQIAYYLSEQTKTSKLQIPDLDLDRFEKLFEVLNNLLPTQ